MAGAAETAAQWIALDTLNETAYRRKMRAHFAAGERGQALETYQACQTVLATELGLEPEPDTAALAARIRTQPLPVQPHSPHAALQSSGPDTSIAFLGSLFAGRIHEQQALEDHYEGAAADQPQLVFLRGAAGIGKTRLARKFLAWAGAQGAELLQGGAFESGSHLPFQPLVDALRQRLAHETLPFTFLGQESFWAAEASECAGKQSEEDFWRYHDYLFERQAGENQGAFTKENLKQFAADLSLDTEAFDECLDSGEFTAFVQSQTENARSVGVQSTPSIVINGRPVIGAQPFEAFQEVIEAELNR